MIKKTKISLLLTAVILGITLAGCGKEVQEESTLTLDKYEQPVTYALVAAAKGTVISQAQIKCTYMQVNEQTITVPASGMVVDSVHVKKGDTVKVGDLLFEMDATSLHTRMKELEYSIARNQLLLTQNETNMENEIEARTVQYDYHSGKSSEEWVEKEEDLKEIRERYRYLREDYSDALALDQEEYATLQDKYAQGQIRSGINGIVSSAKQNILGTTVKKDEILITIIDSSECLFEAEATEYLQYFKEGEPVEMNITYNKAKGDYLLLPYQMESWGEVQTFNVLEQPEGVQLDIGVDGKIIIELDRRENVLTVPRTAVHMAEEQAYVYMVDESNMRKVVFIEAGLFGVDNVEVLSGLSEGDKVILE